MSADRVHAVEKLTAARREYENCNLLLVQSGSKVEL